MAGFLMFFQVVLLLVLFVRAEVCDKNFLIRMEDMVKRLEEVTEFNKQLNKTINTTVEELKAENARQEAVIQEIKGKAAWFRF